MDDSFRTACPSLPIYVIMTQGHVVCVRIQQLTLQQQPDFFMTNRQSTSVRLRVLAIIDSDS